MRLIHVGLAVFVVTALLLLIVGRSLAAELLALGGGLMAMAIFIVGAIRTMRRKVR
jgi:hypothetical protein